MIRPFGGIQTIGAASQPVFGTTMNGAGSILMDQHTLNTSPGSQDSVSVLPLASTVGFWNGARVAVGPKGNFVFGGSLDSGLIIKVTDGVSITVQGLLKAHGSGEYVVLNEAASSVNILSLSTANPMYIGSASTVAVGDPSTFDVIDKISGAGAEQTYWHYSPPTGVGDSYNTMDYWIQGTQNDTFIARFSAV